MMKKSLFYVSKHFFFLEINWEIITFSNKFKHCDSRTKRTNIPKRSSKFVKFKSILFQAKEHNLKRLFLEKIIVIKMKNINH